MITFITPFPSLNQKTDGYWSRVLSIDSLFENEDRTYLEVLVDCSESDLFQYSEEIQGKRKIIKINWNSGLGRTKFEEQIVKAKVIYVHSLYQARYVMPFMPYKKVIIDLHGVVPEENWLYQDKSIFQEMNEIERYVFLYATGIVAVTNKMIAHFKSKYESFDKTFFSLPIVNKNDHNITTEKIISSKKANLFLYSGGTQPWQNISKVYDFIQSSKEKDYKFIFLSPDKDQIQLELEKRNCLGSCELFYSSDFKELLPYYLKAQYGFILRDNNIVNKVACPTKMQEYLQFGIIPVVLTPEIGDFMELSYKTVLFLDEEANIKNSNLDLEECILKNREVLNQIFIQFTSESKKLTEFVKKISVQGQEEDILIPSCSAIVRYFSQIYLHHGDGYSEGVSIKKAISDNKNKIIFEILPEWKRNIKEIRFDPLNKACNVQVKKILINGPHGVLEYDISAYSNQGFFKFKNEDPQIVIPISNFKKIDIIDNIEVHFELETILKKEIKLIDYIKKKKSKFIR